VMRKHLTHQVAAGKMRVVCPSWKVVSKVEPMRASGLVDAQASELTGRSGIGVPDDAREVLEGASRGLAQQRSVLWPLTEQIAQRTGFPKPQSVEHVSDWSGPSASPLRPSALSRHHQGDPWGLALHSASVYATMAMLAGRRGRMARSARRPRRRCAHHVWPVSRHTPGGNGALGWHPPSEQICVRARGGAASRPRAVPVGDSLTRPLGTNLPEPDHRDKSTLEQIPLEIDQAR
jgi:hypothetical protein